MRSDVGRSQDASGATPVIFLSYASKDRDRVAPLARELIDHGWDVWWDRTIPPGKEWGEVIGAAIEKADAVVCVWTKNSIKSRWVKNEANHGMSHNILVPISLDRDVKIPFAYASLQSADLTDWSPDTNHDGFDTLTSALEELVGPRAPSPPEPEPPREPEPVAPRVSGAESKPEPAVEAATAAPPEPDRSELDPAATDETGTLAGMPVDRRVVAVVGVGLLIWVVVVSVLLWTVVVGGDDDAPAATGGGGGDIASVATADGCDGIETALNDLPSHGGEVIVGAGTFECDEPIVIDRDHVTLRGSGSSTVLRVADGANAPLLVVGDTSDPPALIPHHVVVSNLRLDGNSAAQPDECWGGPCADENSRPIRNNTLTIRNANDVLVEDVVASDARSGGLVVERDSRRITVRGFESSGHVFDGLAAHLTEDSTFTNLVLHDNDAAGLSFDDSFDNNVVSDVVITGSGTVGVFMRDSHDNLISDMQIRGSTEHGVFVAQNGSDTSTASTGNTFYGIVVVGSGGDGIHIANESNVDNIIDDVQYAGNAGGCLVAAAPVILGETNCR